MNATEISPSQSIENSLLNYNNASPSNPSFSPPPLQHQPEESARSVSPQDTPSSSSPSSSAEAMDHQPTPPVDTLPSNADNAAQHPPHPPESEPAQLVQGQNHDRMALDSDAPPPPPPPPPSSEPSSQAVEINEDTRSPRPDEISANEPQVSVLNVPNPATSSSEDETSNPPPPAEGSGPNPDSSGPPNPDTLNRENSATESSTETAHDEADDDSDDDSYDGHAEFMAQFEEDNSSPSSQEMREIELIQEMSGTDDSTWEDLVYTSLDDPAYIVGDSGRISWTVQGFHGTKENPNKERVMRSPPVDIGGYRWNIKMFPHGNEGTDQLSVYIECSGETPKQGPVENAKGESQREDEDEEMTNTPTQESANGSLHVAAPEQSTSSDNVNEASESKEERPAPQPEEKQWEVAAQIGCVMYNPQEPRVHVFEKATHHFENASQDWGWVRFYGPWNGIHQRRPLQRQAMLRNDTLSFTAYVRVVKDPTRALWWRSVDQSQWDSVSKTGYRAVTAEEPGGNAFIAAIVPWLHLKPFVDLILEMPVPDQLMEPRKRVRPMFEQLKEFIYAKHSPNSTSNHTSLYRVQRIFDWYEHQFMASTDVIEIWESFRNLLNEEYWADKENEPKHDALGFFKTIRQNIHPVLPFSSQFEPDRSEPSSVQEVVDGYTGRHEADYKDWEGFAGPSQPNPPILQIELHRQLYDTQARKWKKLTHQIKLNETIRYNEVEFTLFAMVIHKGEVGSGKFYSVVRPGGSGSIWVRYKSGLVTYVTHRQAVSSHEGRGTTREGTDSVAYLVSYVRSDMIEKLAPLLPTQPPSKVVGPLEPPKRESDDEEAEKSPTTVVLHASEGFERHSGVGFVDPWTKNNDFIVEVQIPESATMQDLREELVKSRKLAEDPEQVMLWPMKATTNSIRFAPRLESAFLLSKLDDFASRCGGLHFWLHVLSLDEVSKKSEEPASNSSSVSPGSAESEVQPPPPPPGDPEVLLFSSVTASDFLEPPPPPPPPPPAEPAEEATDVVMGGTQEPVPDPPSPIPEPPVQEPPVIELPQPKWQKDGEVYIFLKYFDPRTQTLLPIGTAFGNSQKSIGDCLSKSKGIPESIQKSFKIHQEVDSLVEDSEISPASTFSMLGLGNGTILVLSDSEIPESELSTIKLRGDAASTPEYFQSLSFLGHFGYQGRIHTDSYFGGPYTHGPLRNGRAFGNCIMIDDSTGDAYVGNCIAGAKAGHGTMFFANGDQYTGEWANSLPEGQGTMTYNTTGNIYIGGWKKGRRHGKGVMKFEVADEELQLCKICYENEMDALFYRCGHVAACETCARQVHDCPVCRRTVDAVVKIWKT